MHSLETLHIVMRTIVDRRTKSFISSDPIQAYTSETLAKEVAKTMNINYADSESEFILIHKVSKCHF